MTAILNYDQIYTGHLWVARVGNAFTTPSSGTVSRDTAPAAASDAWRKLPDVQEFSISAEVEKKPKYGISLGQRIRNKMIVMRRDISISATVNSMNKQWFDTLLASDEDDAEDDFASHGSQSQEYWIRLQPYDALDVNRMIIQGLALLNLDSVNFNDDFPTAQFVADMVGRLSGTFVNAYAS
jgi:hypothetical protein